MRRFIAALLAVLFVLSAYAADADETGEISARYLLMDANGRAVSNEDFPGYFQLIAFGYTFCPDICPTTLAEMSVVMEKLGKASDRLQPLFITVDPERDTAPVLRNYTVFFHPRIMGLTGSSALVRRAADNFKVRYEKAREPGSPPDQYAVDHSAGMYLLGPDGRYIRKFAFGTAPEEVAAVIGEIIANTTDGSRARSGRAQHH
jgi:protein SCO1/2